VKHEIRGKKKQHRGDAAFSNGRNPKDFLVIVKSQK
jgi:hypothetical protein